jgi:hypothetical protein
MPRRPRRQAAGAASGRIGTIANEKKKPPADAGRAEGLQGAAERGLSVPRSHVVDQKSYQPLNAPRPRGNYRISDRRLALALAGNRLSIIRVEAVIAAGNDRSAGQLIFASGQMGTIQHDHLNQLADSRSIPDPGLNREPVSVTALKRRAGFRQSRIERKP